MNLKSNQKTVFVGLSGGVDSAVSAYLLQKQGFEVVGCFIKTWQPDFIDCNWKEERRDAMRVASHLQIPFLTINLEKEYKEAVADYMISEYKKGRTPNPDVMCNKEIKFGGFLRQALANGADFVATGHYARNKKINERQCLLKATDEAKEQSYFLWTLGQEQLSKILFPIGDLQKSEVRKIAKKAKLPVAEKKDSQGVCFIGKFDFKDFLRHFIEEKRGDVLDINRQIIGYHNGVSFLTLGERRGFTITKKGVNDERVYIISKDVTNNTIIVGDNISLNENSEAKKEVLLENTNWINQIPTETQKYKAQIRYHSTSLDCIIKIQEKDTKIIFDKPQLVASGQSIVLYDGEICVGGGVVK